MLISFCIERTCCEIQKRMNKKGNKGKEKGNGIPEVCNAISKISVATFEGFEKHITVFFGEGREGLD